MTYPVLLRRAAGVILGLVTCLTAAGLAYFVIAEGGGALVVLAFLAAFVVPTLVALVPLMRTAAALADGRHAGDRMLFWSLLFLVGPLVFAVRFPLFRVLVALVVLANVLYAVGAASKHDPPG